MSSSKRRRHQQQRLTFEAVSEADSPALGQGLSPAKVRFQSPKDGSPSSRSVRPLKMARSKKPRQQTLDASLSMSVLSHPATCPQVRLIHLYFGSLCTFWLTTVLCSVMFPTANSNSQAKTNPGPNQSSQKMSKVRMTICPYHWETT